LLAFAVFVDASSHGEAPNQVKTPLADLTDLYAFVSYESGRSDFVTVLMNVSPLQDGGNGPNYHFLDERFFYELNVDLNGDGVPDKVFQVVPTNELANSPNGIQLNIDGMMQSIPLKFAGPITAGDNSNLGFLEFYRVNLVSGGSSSSITQSGTSNDVFVKPFDFAGVKTFPNYTAYANQYIYTIDIPGCSDTGRVFIGQRNEAFHINIGPIFDLVNFVPVPPNELKGHGINQNTANNQLKLKNMITIAFEISKTCLGVSNSNPVVGFWATTRNKNRLTQKSRLGNPLVNELIIGLPSKDHWSKRSPNNDGQLNQFIAFPTFPAILNSLFLQAINSILGTSFSTIAPTNLPREDLVAIFLTGIPGINELIASSSLLIEELRLNTSIAPVSQSKQKSYGVFGGDVAGYPNGRRPGDDVIDISLQALMGRVCILNLGVCTASQANAAAFNFTDGAPISANNFTSHFPYLNIPVTSST